MTGTEFLRRLRRLGRARGVPVTHDPGHGKGSHGTVGYGARTATLPYLRRELAPGTFRALCRQLGIDPEDIRSA